MKSDYRYDEQKMTEDLINAVTENDVQTVNDLLNLGADPNRSLDSAHITPLHFAAQNNCLEVIPLLYEAGGDVFALTEPEGHSPLDVALMHGHDRVAQLLIFYWREAGEWEH